MSTHIRGAEEIMTPDGIGTVVEFDPNNYGGRDVKVFIHALNMPLWYYSEELEEINDAVNKDAATA